MTRFIINTLTTLSLLLFAATAGLWLRSYWYWDQLSPSTNAVLSMESQPGAARFDWRVWSPPPPFTGPWVWNSARAGRIPFGVIGHWSILGIEGGTWTIIIDDGGLRTTMVQYYLVVPYWVFCLLELILPAAWLIHRLRSHPPQAGLCPTCRYDLRGHAGGAAGIRCPECGTPIPATHEAQT